MAQTTLLAIALACLWTQGGATITTAGKMYTNSNLSNVVFNENILFIVQSASPGHCALTCNRECLCKTFTFYDNHCRGHDIRVNASTGLEPRDGAQTFGLQRDAALQLTGWLHSKCVCDAECADVTDAVCYKGVCLCTPGYFFSVSNQTCVPECNDLHHTYMLYEDSVISGHNNFSQPAPDCASVCTSDPDCVNFEIRAARDRNSHPDCNTHHVTALNVPGAWIPFYPGYDNYQRNCA